MHTRSMLVMAVIALLVAACDTTRPPQGPATQTCKPTVSEPAVAVGTFVPLLNVPAGTTTLLASLAGEELLVTELDDGGYALLAPFADSDDPYHSGPVLVSLSADGQPCSDLTLRIEGLPHPDTPGVRGSFSAAVTELLQGLDDLDAQRSGADAHLTDLISYLEYMVRSDDNPNALSHVLASGTMTIDGDIVAVDFDLLDALLAHGAAAPSASAPGASAGTWLAATVAPQVVPTNALRTLRDAVRLASTPTGLAGLLAAQDDAKHVQKPALALTAGAVVAAGAVASLWLPGIGAAASYAAISISMSQLVLVETQVAFLPNDLTMTFDIDSPDLDEDGEGRWSNLQLRPSNQGSPDVVRAGVGAVLTVLGAKADPSSRTGKLIATLLSAATDLVLKSRGIDSVAIAPYDWAPVPIPIEEAGLWTNPYAEGVIEHHPTPPTYEATTTGAGQVGLRLQPSLFLQRDYHATQDVFVHTIQVIVSPENAVLAPGESIQFDVTVLHADDERVVWSTSDGIIRTELESFTWAAPDAAALSDDCANANSVTFEIRAESISLTGARQLKHNPPLRYGVAEVEVLCDDDLTGTWTGNWSSSVEWAGGALYVELQQNGSALTGSIDVTNSPCLARGAVSGTVSGDDATFGAVQGADTIVFSASIANASSMGGTYAVTTGECAGDAGVFSLTRLP